VTPFINFEEVYEPLNLFVFTVSVDLAVTTAHKALFTHAAQVCFASSRVFVHSKIYDKFVAKSVELAKKRIVGDPFNSETKQGPQVQ
jgi:acyl-CoA reductase-like NAD-dependent aldehyde dehydrogenase